MSRDLRLYLEDILQNELDPQQTAVQKLLESI